MIISIKNVFFLNYDIFLKVIINEMNCFFNNINKFYNNMIFKVFTQHSILKNLVDSYTASMYKIYLYIVTFFLLSNLQRSTYREVYFYVS